MGGRSDVGKKLANVALTELQSSSDAGNMYTRAVINDDGTCTINDAKAWVSLAGEVDAFLTVVKISDESDRKDMAMTAFPADAKGVGFGPGNDTLPYEYLPLSELLSVVPCKNVLKVARYSVPESYGEKRLKNRKYRRSSLRRALEAIFWRQVYRPRLLRSLLAGI